MYRFESTCELYDIFPVIIEIVKERIDAYTHRKTINLLGIPFILHKIPPCGKKQG